MNVGEGNVVFYVSVIYFMTREDYELGAEAWKIHEENPRLNPCDCVHYAQQELSKKEICLV